VNPINEALLELSSSCTSVMLTASGQISPGPNYLFCIDLSPEDATAVWQLDVYDGETEDGRHLFKLEGQFLSRHLAFHPPHYLTRGLYLKFTTNIGSVTVQYLTRRD